ncbi:MAG: ribonuclease VapC [Candidatus Roseilinea sp.]|nr:MAG: ribonuclease VapC [Candidatus Roseilinea sp.]
MHRTIMDTSFLFALMSKRDSNHAKCRAVVESLRESPLLPVTVLPEVAYLIHTRIGHHAMRRFTGLLSEPIWDLVTPDQDDFARAAAVLETYASLALDFVDATVVALAERLKVSTILTLDRRHFQPVRPRHAPAFTLLPD